MYNSPQNFLEIKEDMNLYIERASNYLEKLTQNGQLRHILIKLIYISLVLYIIYKYINTLQYMLYKYI